MDIVEKLQRLSGYLAAAGEDDGYPVCDEAADEIARLREALERIATVDMGGGFLGAQASRKFARAALEAKP